MQLFSVYTYSCHAVRNLAHTCIRTVIQCFNYHLGTLTQSRVISTSMVQGEDIIRNRAVPGEGSKALCSVAHGGCERNFYPP